MKDIKALAQQAKNRLKGLCGLKTAEPKLRLIKGGDGTIKVIAKEKESEKLYQKYKDIIMSDSVHNPLACMMDKRMYNKMCDEMKEKYFFETLEKYKSLRERCSKESNHTFDMFA
jgi:hypothetical protein